MADILDFEVKSKEKGNKTLQKSPQFNAEGARLSPLTSDTIEMIGFLTSDDRDIFIDDPADILEIMQFIKLRGIKISENIDLD